MELSSNLSNVNDTLSNSDQCVVNSSNRTNASDPEIEIDTSTYPNQDMESKDSPQPDLSTFTCGIQSVRSLAILALGFVLITVGAGISHSYGVLLVAFIGEEDVSATQAAVVTGIEQFMFYGSGRFLAIIK